MFQADYSRKTQELAEQRKSFEAERAERAKLDGETLQKRGELAHAERMLKAYAEFDWAKLEDDPSAYAKANHEWQRWREHKDALKAQIAEDEESTRGSQRESTAKRIEEARTVLARDITNWHEIGPKVAEHAIRNLGYSVQDLATMTDPRLGKLMHQAWIGSQLIAKQKAATAKGTTHQPEEPEPKPAPTVGRGKSPTAAPRDSDDIETWMRKERQRTKARHA